VNEKRNELICRCDIERVTPLQYHHITCIIKWCSFCRSVIFARFSGRREPLHVCGDVLWTWPSDWAWDGCGAGRGAPPGESAARLDHNALVQTDVDVPVRHTCQSWRTFALWASCWSRRSGICRLVTPSNLRTWPFVRAD